MPGRAIGNAKKQAATKKRAPAKRVAKKVAPKMKANRTEIPADELVKHTMGYKGGCISGKVDFLKSLGLNAPTHQYQATITVTLASQVELPAKDLAKTLKAQSDYIEEGIVEWIADDHRFDSDYDEWFDSVDPMVTTTPFRKL